MTMQKNAVVLTGAGQIGMAIVRRVAYGSKIFVADWKLENAQAITKTLVEAGFDAVAFKT
ncbi:MAG TPA: short-chain dehydrogenase, partial [Bacteroidetes bacterium]|nr:short-chain dehydrogenase [Bacteroidota bacterium]